jgi:phenylalanyl-tRNA synthetase beta chain
MRVSLDWLAEFVDLPPDEDLVHRLNMGGFEDARVEARGPDLSALVVGRVDAREPHPEADRLSVCTVDVGDGTTRQIVCGAPNVATGQMVAVALPKTRLPDGTKIKKAKLRGVVSEGMICSERELTLSDAHEGILVLETGASPGTPLSDVLRAGDRVLEVGITPNRGDTASLLGLAREVHAFFGGAVRLPETKPDESGAPAADAIRIAIDAEEACYRYVGRVVRGVRVGPSPDWVARRLEASGIRPINNVVDATNLVLLELGQPLHAFDLATLRGAEIRVRHARAGETIVTLDGQERRLDRGDLVIADAERAIALAGVMGGAATEVGEATRDLLIESAHFQPTGVRLTARRHGLHSEASYRFERGVDREGIARAADRAARLVTELAGGTVAPGGVEARGEAPPVTESIALEVSRSNRLLGTAIAPDEAASLLERVGVACRAQGRSALTCRIPSHRNDLHVHQDLTEEIARVYGYENIEPTLPVAELRPVTLPPAWDLAERARDALAAAGLIETMSFPFVSARDLERLGLAEDDPRRLAVRLRNPIQEGEPLLRTLLVPSLLRLAQQNRSRQIEEVRLFEVSRVFRPQGDPSQLPREPLHVAALLTRSPERRLWAPPNPPPIFFEARGIAERLLSALGYVASLRRGGDSPFLHPGASAAIEVGGRAVGSIGEVHPAVLQGFEIDVPCAVIELNLEALQAVKGNEVQYQEVSKEPQIRRDIAVLLDREQSAGEVVEVIRKSGGSDLVSVELFDRYEGRGVPEGRISLGFRLVFQRADRTLVDAEVTQVMDRVVRTLAERFGAELRHG